MSASRTIGCPRCGRQMIVRSTVDPQRPGFELVTLAQLEGDLHHVYDCGNCQLVVLRKVAAEEVPHADDLR